MCGRFVLHTPPPALADYFDIDAIPDLAASYNITPSQSIAAVRKPGQHREMVLLRWGLVPSWAQELKTKFPEMPGIGFYGSPPGNHARGGKRGTPSAFKVDLNDTATLELIQYASQLSKELHPDAPVSSP